MVVPEPRAGVGFQEKIEEKDGKSGEGATGQRFRGKQQNHGGVQLQLMNKARLLFLHLCLPPGHLFCPPPAPGTGVSSILGLLDCRLGSGFFFTPAPYPQTWSASSLLMSEHPFSSLIFLVSHAEKWSAHTHTLTFRGIACK